MRREDHQVADVLLDAVVAVLLDEPAPQTLGRHVGGDAARVDARPGPSRWPRGRDRWRRSGPGASAPGAPRYSRSRIAMEYASSPVEQPGTHTRTSLSVRSGIQELRQSAPGKRVERRRVPEEARHPDQKLPKQRIHLLGVDLQVAQILLDRPDLMHVHAPLDAPPARAGLVDGEVVARSVAERDEDAPERRRLAGEPLSVSAGHARQERADLLHHRGRRPDVVDGTRTDGALRHSRVLGALDLLRHRHASVRLDRLQPECPVRPRPRQDHADRTVALILSQRAEEIVDGQRHVGHPSS